MGNCIVLQEKIVKVVKKDGKILEYKAPIKVHQVLSQFSGHVISNSLQVIDNQHLQPDDDLLGGQIYYLLPQLPVQPPPKSAKKKVKFVSDQVKKKVKFANDQLVEEEVKQKTEVVRIKIVITKKELQALLNSEDGLIKVGDIKSTTIVDDSTTNGIEWKPVLDIIPELN
ncbi:uncharacterized protein LOC132614156 isoform X1 [Lycium barbarum]|uniref:uncharacterized protein LOC132614156 isoform X1 n=1 Tax=Lycium barbarum TaxID=112863 RepID=UPI00293F7019|nr:uncharacterized protein LOC132614156 isoform X1 [Lycium barbarum]